jgi:PIN domain nuclease of toxin-antitoxin system
MRLLLDTHALLWWLGDEEKLSAAARAPIADPANEVLVSVASLWEIVVKHRVGKLHADIGAIERAMGRDGFTRLPITAAHLAVLAALPQHHRDPFDHLLIAQAISEAAVFVSQDRHAELYDVKLLPCTMP